MIGDGDGGWRMAGGCWDCVPEVALSVSPTLAIVWCLMFVGSRENFTCVHI